MRSLEFKGQPRGLYGAKTVRWRFLKFSRTCPTRYPNKYVLGSVDIPDHISPDFLTDRDLPAKWATLAVEQQGATRQLGDDWLMRKSSVALSIPSVTSGERNFLLNLEHPQIRDLRFHSPVPFRFDARLLRMPADQV